MFSLPSSQEYCEVIWYIISVQWYNSIFYCTVCFQTEIRSLGRFHLSKISLDSFQNVTLNNDCCSSLYLIFQLSKGLRALKLGIIHIMNNHGIRQILKDSRIRWIRMLNLQDSWKKFNPIALCFPFSTTKLMLELTQHSDTFPSLKSRYGTSKEENLIVIMLHKEMIHNYGCTIKLRNRHTLHSCAICNQRLQHNSLHLEV